MEVQYLKAYGDFKLIVNQIRGEYKVYHEDLISYHHSTIQLANTLCYISHVSRLQNTKADAIAPLAVTLALPADTAYRLTVATRHLFYLKCGLKDSEVHTTSINIELRER